MNIEDKINNLKIRKGMNLKIKEIRINITNRKIINIKIIGDESNFNINA